MEWGIAGLVMMAVMMGAMLFGGHGMHKKHKEHKQEAPSVAQSTAAAHGMTAPSDSSGPAQAQQLDEGSYSGSVHAIVCASCVSKIEQTLNQRPGIEMAKVDAKSQAVQFRVNAGKTVSLTELQAALKRASDEMGMGADYRLREVQKVILSPAAGSGTPSDQPQRDIKGE